MGDGASASDSANAGTNAGASESANGGANAGANVGVSAGANAGRIQTQKNLVFAAQKNLGAAK